MIHDDDDERGDHTSINSHSSIKTNNSNLLQISATLNQKQRQQKRKGPKPWLLLL